MKPKRIFTRNVFGKSVALKDDAEYQKSLANYYTKSEIDTKIGNIETLLASI